MALKDRVLLLVLNTGSWSARKLDRAVTREVNDRHDTGDRLNTSKRLVDKATLLKPTQILSEARAYVKDNTLPYGRIEGMRIVPGNRIMEIRTKLMDLRMSFESAVSAIPHLNTILEAESKRLNDTFNRADYPATDRDMRDKFYFELSFMPMPSTGETPEFLDSVVRDEVEASRSKALTYTSTALFERVHDNVSHMVERLEAFDNRLARQSAGEEVGKADTFRNTLVENIRDLVNILPDFNFNNDPELAKLTKSLENKLTKFDADQLREDDGTRAKVKADAKALEEEVQRLIGKSSALYA